jgi:hypothetical protein
MFSAFKIIFLFKIRIASEPPECENPPSRRAIIISFVRCFASCSASTFAFSASFSPPPPLAFIVVEYIKDRMINVCKLGG